MKITVLYWHFFIREYQITNQKNTEHLTRLKLSTKMDLKQKKSINLMKYVVKVQFIYFFDIIRHSSRNRMMSRK